MRIHRFLAENIKRLSVVEITPDGSPVVILAGENEAGKSSCLDSIEMALGGERRAQDEPVRRGAKRASISIDLGDIIVTRTFTASGGSALKVTNRDGAKYPSPQAMLDGLFNKLTFDPLAFGHAKPQEQADTLRRLVGLETADLDEQRRAVFDERTLINRDLKKAEAVLIEFDRALPKAEAPAEPVDVKALTNQLAAADELAEAAAKLREKANRAAADVEAGIRRVSSADAGVERAKQALRAAEQEAHDAREALTGAESALVAAKAAEEAAAQAVPDRAAIRARLGDAHIQNQRADAQKRRQEARKTVRALQEQADELTARLEQIDQEKAARLAAAKFPVEGLGLTENGVTWNGLPFSQASTAIRTRVSVAIGLALHPSLNVLLIRNGNDLDEKNLKAIAEQAAEAGAQLWIEKIAGGNGMQTVWIEDGEVASVEPAAV